MMSVVMYTQSVFLERLVMSLSFSTGNFVLKMKTIGFQFEINILPIHLVQYIKNVKSKKNAELNLVVQGIAGTISDS